jgi:F-type H+-transporting ATPase subunit epsilon
MADNKKIEVRLLTPTVRSALSQYKYQGEADMVIVRALGDEKSMGGDMGFLYGHVPCSAVLDAGVLRIIPGDGADELKLAVLGGAVQVEDNVVTIITETAEWPEDIDRPRSAARRDDLLARMNAAADMGEKDELNRQIKDLNVLIAVSHFPPSGISHEKG